MAVAAVQPVLLAVQRLVDQAVHAAEEGADGQVQAVFQHRHLQVVGTLHLQMQVHRRIQAAERADHLGQRQCRIAHGGIEHAEVEGAAQFALERRRVAFEAVQLAEDAQDFLVEQLALLGQAETAAATVAEDDAELALQLAHVGADRRGGKVQLLLGGGEALVAHDAGEDAQELDVGQGAGAHGRLREGWKGRYFTGPLSDTRLTYISGRPSAPMVADYQTAPATKARRPGRS
ncbi:hypothetical protein D3C76_1076210 [compost metagenome]